ncbi:transcriptional regulator, TetR family [Streptoalloteichus tenebrarius]|uniref:Transcriptional regulator, TetR family n=1 Tax=Streptoalloteichus tenebrarius (strain ATCC 17920 / DSM 40477 / JCM 4838 / CBS 697.72 / NBRC 16177 / NCIMB 11028 / NRRL B-12390 / A12253. 1 / ISP 5477) TaxID=1933 RepID=A0ABT1I0V5_STRSD|nr:TetR/AcrR family transcriptional regulator [Streptoalloteichus tenebrarius]MCP2261394.1 transcriptional regulator, TetR family [Streptoalloteichus tenebrarius]BFF01997.1 TetR/AcrR family transcriptional regulator [Streptoalloteichus tenebrarius]
MTEATRRERLRADTERDIRATARALLVGQGRDAVTLRAIARELGITAPALYRYYDSREALLRAVCEDICADLDAELTPALRGVSAHDPLGRVFAVCRAFRRWALAHPQEFELVFASPEEESVGLGRRPAQDRFGGVFIHVIGHVLVAPEAFVPTTDEVPAELHDDLVAYRERLRESLAEAGIQVPNGLLELDGVYFILKWWVRLYGHIALEVFGRFPFPLRDAEPLFERMLTELAVESGFPTGTPATPEAPESR